VKWVAFKSSVGAPEAIAKVREPSPHSSDGLCGRMGRGQGEGQELDKWVPNVCLESQLLGCHPPPTPSRFDGTNHPPKREGAPDFCDRLALADVLALRRAGIPNPLILREARTSSRKRRGLKS